MWHSLMTSVYHSSVYVFYGQGVLFLETVDCAKYLPWFVTKTIHHGLLLVRSNQVTSLQFVNIPLNL